MTEGIACTPRLNSSRCLGLGSGFALAIIWNFGRPNRSVLKTIFKIWEFEGESRFGLDVWLCLERVVSLSVVCVSQSTSLTHDYKNKTNTNTTCSKRQADTRLLEPCGWYDWKRYKPLPMKLNFVEELDVSTFYESLGAQSGYQISSFSTNGWSGNKVSHNRKRNQTNNVNKLGETSQMSRQVHNNNFSSNLVSIFSFQIFNFGKTNYLESVSMNLTPSRGFVLFLFTLCSFSIQENKLLKAKCWQPYNP